MRKVSEAVPTAHASTSAVLVPVVATTRPSRSRRLASFGSMAVLLVLAGTLVSLFMRHYPKISPIDELTHIDATVQASHGHLSRRGDLFGKVAMREESCRGLDYPYLTPPPCTSPALLPAQYQDGGYDTAYIHPPLYYLVSGLGARVLLRASHAHSFVTGARLMGIFWLGAGLIVLWLALSELQVPVGARLIPCVLVLTAPTVLHASATVNPDGSAVLAGSAMLYAVLRWERGACPTWMLAFVAALAIAANTTNVAAIGACAIYLLIRALHAWRGPLMAGAMGLDAIPAPSTTPTILHRPDAGPRLASLRGNRVWRYVNATVLTLAGGAVTSLVWSAVMRATAYIPLNRIPMIQAYKVQSLIPPNVTSQLVAVVFPLSNAFVPTRYASHLLLAVADIVSLVVVAGAIVAIGLTVQSRRSATLGTSALLSLVAMGPVYVLINFFFSGIYITIPPRYGLSVVPLLVAAGAIVFRYRWTIPVTAALALAALAIDVGTLASR